MDYEKKYTVKKKISLKASITAIFCNERILNHKNIISIDMKSTNKYRNNSRGFNLYTITIYISIYMINDIRVIITVHNWQGYNGRVGEYMAADR